MLDALKAGDELAFVLLLRSYGPAMLRVAMLHVTNRAVAEEVVQDTWINVLNGLDRFQGRSSLKTWVFAILVNCARKRAEREDRTVPFSAVASLDAELRDRTAEPDEFFPAEHPRWPYAWSTVVPRWETMPEDQTLSRETIATIRAAIALLPPNQRAVLVLRDVEGWSPGDVCELLGLSDGNQRILLHRARCRVRRELERRTPGNTLNA
jgi:RNA polymerase sigma-70 factor (ECF subfamily)